jgi:hypothetical protein
MSGLFGLGFAQHERVWLRIYGSAETARDHEGFTMKRADYGDRNSPYGWELDHIIPKALGGADHDGNLRPRHCKGNASAGATLGNALRRGLF